MPSTATLQASEPTTGSWELGSLCNRDGAVAWDGGRWHSMCCVWSMCLFVVYVVSRGCLCVVRGVCALPYQLRARRSPWQPLE